MHLRPLSDLDRGLFVARRDAMISKPMDVLQNYPIRKTRSQKQSFRDAVFLYLQNIGYEVTVEKGKFKQKIFSQTYCPLLKNVYNV